MSNATATHRSTRLRRDLRSITVDGRRRAYRIVIDEISGRFTRVSEHVWQALRRGDLDESVWQEARAAGWTRERTPSQRRTFSPLYFRIPIGSVDSLAARLAPFSSVVFSAAAILIWSTLIAVAGMLAASRSAELLASLGSLRLFLTQSDPVWLGVLFIGTKIAHELAHAVMCRRMGSRCGSVGILFLVGVPCPYCDVTDIWRQPSAARRAAVMLAGIYIELIIAAIATLVWVSAVDPAIRLYALNLMVVCGISTIVFNANPLMRYDGYYVLGDLVGSTNLRQEAGKAFAGVVSARIAGPAYSLARRGDFRSIALAGFHAASSLYRVLVAIAIATLLLGVAEYFHLRTVAVGIVWIAVIAAAARVIRRVIHIARGLGRWNDVPVWRRAPVGLGIGLLAAAVLFMPLPRFRRATGWVDASSAASVFLPSDGIVEEVATDIGSFVETGDILMRLRSESLAIQRAKLGGQLRVARLRSNLSRRVTLNRVETASQWRTEQWMTLQAAQDAVEAQLASTDQRIRQTEIAAPESGVVLPAQSSVKWLDPSTSLSLRDRVGTAADAHAPWCRIAPDAAMNAILVIDARDRTNIDVGAAVNINLTESPEIVFRSTVAAVSAIENDEPSVTRQAAYQVLCPLPDVDRQDMLRWLGKECRGVFHLPHRTLASDMTQWMSEWLGGQ